MLFQLTYRFHDLALPSPRTPGNLDYRFRISTHANPFEIVDMQIRGAAFAEELLWSLASPAHADGLQADAGELIDGNHLVLNEVPLGEPAAQVLALRNITTQAINFELNMDTLGQFKDALSIAPAAGTIAPSTTCLVHLAFKSEEPLKLTRHAVVFNATFSQGAEGSAIGSKAPQKPKAKTKSKHLDSKAEGAASEKADPQSPEELLLYISAATDIRRCELSISSIHFETTALFKTRMFSFTIVSCIAASVCP